MPYNLYSHPNILLKDHLHETRNSALHLLKQHNIFTEYQDILEIAALFHDLGKASSYFQNYILKKKTTDNKDLRKHSEISALWAYIYTKNIMQKDEKTALITYLIIKRHHGNIKDFRDNFGFDDEEQIIKINKAIDYDELREIYSEFLNTDHLNSNYFTEHLPDRLSGTARQNRENFNFTDYFLINYLFSLLIYADKYHAIFTDQYNIISNIKLQCEYVKNFKNSLTKSDNIINEIREEAFMQAENNLNAHDKIFSLNLPTGCGKTLNAINLAIKLTELDDSLERIVYCLPFTSIIDQNEQVFQNILKYNNIAVESNILLKHHHLSNFDYKTTDNESYSDQESEFLIETWESQLIVTTFFQLLHSLLSNQNRALRKFHNISNSVIILDEVQAIPHKYWKLINETLTKATELLNCKIILVTATMPLMFDEAKGEITELASSKKEFFKKLNRIDLNLNWFDKIDIKNLIVKLKENIDQHSLKSHLIICNTINSATDIYEQLSDAYPDREVLYLSTHILPLHRLETIAKIRDNPKGKIIVSTQLVEAGVDIDIDFVYRDFAPLDSIFQSCGRCNRNNQQGKSQVFLYELISENNLPLHSYIYDSVLTDITRGCLRNKDIIEEKGFYDLALDYYTKISQRTSSDNKVYKNISNLDYEEAFGFKGKEPFKLIDNDYKTVTCFIEFDDYAKTVYQNYCILKDDNQENAFEKRILLKKAFRDMAPYIIDIPANLCEGDSEFFYISAERKDAYYSKERGFKKIHEEEDYFF